MGREWSSGVYEVQNKKKYLGYNMPKYRSSWERRFAYYCDTNAKVLRWGYEVVTIPYNYQIDGKMHKYITDFYVEIIDNKNEVQKYIVEIKPKKQTKLPVKPKNKNAKAIKRYINERNTYVRNDNKWRAAKSFCQSNNMEFVILTENTIF